MVVLQKLRYLGRVLSIHPIPRNDVQERVLNK
jgi:hypothetical protein